MTGSESAKSIGQHPESRPGTKLWVAVFEAYVVSDSREEAWKKTRKFEATHPKLMIQRVSLVEKITEGLKPEDFDGI